MKNSIFVTSCLLLVMLCFADSFSQTNSKDSVNSLKSGMFSLQFSVGENLTIGALNGYAVSCMYDLSRRSAVRFGIAGAFRNNRGNFTEDSLISEYYDYAYSFTIDPAFLMYFNEKSALTLFAGAGPIISYSYGRTKGHGSAYDDRYATETNWEAGAKFMLGCEWFFMRRVSLFADYEASLTFGNQKRTDDYYDYNNATENHFKSEIDVTNFRANTARFGLSVYF